MPRNIEIKARIDSVEALRPRAEALAGAPAVLIVQDDSFFTVPQGRLKLRQFEDGSAELIHYHRADSVDAKASDYVRVPVPDPAALREALARACGLQGRVRKQRWLCLGDFMELEVVLQDGQSDAEGQATAEALMQQLGLAQAERLAGAYLDLLAAAG
jgi:adenylate cyclase class IV